MNNENLFVALVFYRLKWRGLVAAYYLQLIT